VETREQTLRLKDWQRVAGVVRTIPGVQVFTARVRSTGLLAFGNRTSGVEIVGVQPTTESASNRIVRKSRIEGRYLEPGDTGKVVIGTTLAKRLDVEVEDDLYVTLSGRKEIASAMLRIVGILDSGSRELDAAFCHVMLEDLASMTGYEGAGEITIVLDRHDRIARARAALASTVGEGNQVITWKQVAPELAANVEGDTAFTRILIAIIIVVVSLGIAGAQLTAVLERRREFAVLSALGMKGRQLVAVLMLESVIIGVGGAVVAIAIGGPVAHLLATKGVDISAMAGGELSYGGVLLEPIMKGSFGIWIVWYAISVSLAATIVASLYPAWFATRTNPADALRTAH
jgi:ABC-type lipoprotein release transport system permease subunit